MLERVHQLHPWQKAFSRLFWDDGVVKSEQWGTVGLIVLLTASCVWRLWVELLIFPLHNRKRKIQNMCSSVINSTSRKWLNSSKSKEFIRRLKQLWRFRKPACGLQQQKDHLIHVACLDFQLLDPARQSLPVSCWTSRFVLVCLADPEETCSSRSVSLNMSLVDETRQFACYSVWVLSCCQRRQERIWETLHVTTFYEFLRRTTCETRQEAVDETSFLL